MFQVEQDGADGVLRMGPTPWVKTSHPLGVSIGEPQFDLISSHGRVGVWIVMASLSGDRRLSSRSRCFPVPPGQA
jgi:hypothetical protein